MDKPTFDRHLSDGTVEHDIDPSVNPHLHRKQYHFHWVWVVALCMLFFASGFLCYRWHYDGSKEAYDQSLWLRQCEEDCVDLHTTDCRLECRAQYRKVPSGVTCDNPDTSTTSGGER